MTTTFRTLPTAAEAAEPRLNALLIGVLSLWDDRGDAIHMREVALALRQRGIAPTVLCLTGPQAPAGADLPEVRVAPSRKRFRFQLSWNLLGTLAALKAIRRQRVDVIYTRLDPGMIVGWLASRLTGRPLVVEMNGLPSEDVRLYRPHNRMLLAVTRLWEGWMYRAAQAIVAAPGYAEFAHRQFLVPSRKFCVTPLGVNLDLFYPRDCAASRAQFGLPDAPTVGWMGTVAGWQGMQTLVEAAAQVRAAIPTARFLIVGDGIALPEVQARVAALGLEDAFIFTGRVPYEQVPEYLGAADVCVAMFPGSRGKKGSISALKTVSYLACGRPTVTTEMDEMGRAIEMKGAGYAVPPDDPAALAERLTGLLAESPEAWATRSACAVELVGYGRSWAAAADLIAARLREVAR